MTPMYACANPMLRIAARSIIRIIPTLRCMFLYSFLVCHEARGRIISSPLAEAAATMLAFWESKIAMGTQVFRGSQWVAMFLAKVSRVVSIC